MAKIPTRVRQVTPSGRVAGAVIPFDIADTGQGIEAQGLAGLGRGVGDLGISLGKIAFAEGTSEASTARGLADQEIRLLQESLSRNNDPNTYDAEFDATIEKIKVLRPESGIGGKQFDDFLEDAIPQWQTGINIQRIQKTASLIRGDYFENLSRANIAGDPDEAARLIDEAENTTGVITPEQAARDRIASRNSIEKVLGERDINSVVSRALIFTVSEGPAKGLPDTKEGLKLIRESGLSPTNKVKANTTYNALVKQQKDALEVNQEADRDKLNDVLRTGKGWTQSLTDNTSLSESEQLSYDKLFKTWAADKAEVVTNEQIRADLRASAYDIWRGATTKSGFYDLLNESRYGDNPTIDDAAYKELAALAETTLEQTQGEALSQSHRRGREELVDLTQETFISLALQNKLTEDQIEKNRNQLWWASRFDNEMEQWIQDNPDKNKREFYQAREMILFEYSNRSAEDLAALRGQRRISLVSAREKAEVIRAGETVAADFLAAHPLESLPNTGFGQRENGTPKGTGFLGVLKIKGGGVATEYTTQSNAVKVDGKRIDFPSLVPTLTEAEVRQMTDDIIPNRKKIPEPIMRKAIDHANKRTAEGKSVFATELERVGVKDVKPAKDKTIVRMQAPGGRPGDPHFFTGIAAVGFQLDRGMVFPPGSNVQVKRNTTEKDIEFGGITIKPGARIISLDGGKTWQLLP